MDNTELVERITNEDYHLQQLEVIIKRIHSEYYKCYDRRRRKLRFKSYVNIWKNRNSLQ